jgi:hypothetical protein
VMHIVKADQDLTEGVGERPVAIGLSLEPEGPVTTGDQG